MTKDAFLEGYYGGRGQGKSTGAKNRIRSEKRVIAFDPVKEYHEERGFKIARSLNDVKRLMIEGKGKAYKIAYQYTSSDHEQSLHELCRFLFAAQKPYKDGLSKNKIMLVVDEMNLSAPSHNLPVNQRGFAEAVLQGRHYGISIIGITQRPKTIAPIFRDNTQREIVYRLSCADSIAYIQKKIPNKADKDLILGLKPHEFVEIDGFSIKKGKNRLR